MHYHPIFDMFTTCTKQHQEMSLRKDSSCDAQKFTALSMLTLGRQGELLDFLSQGHAAAVGSKTCAGERQAPFPTPGTVAILSTHYVHLTAR